MNKIAIVEQIHKEFHTAFAQAESIILNKTEKLRADLGAINTPEVAYDFAAQLGFGAVKEATEAKALQIKKKNLSDKERSITFFKERIQSMALLLQYRIIAFSQVLQILEKYGLVLGVSDNYVGTMPARNLKEVDAYITRFRAHVANTFSPRSATFLNNLPICAQHPERSGGGPIFLVCAPIQDFKQSPARHLVGREVVYNETLGQSPRVEPVPVPDPIVLSPLFFDDEYIDSHKFMHIVTAWGPEASDPAVINSANN